MAQCPSCSQALSSEDFGLVICSNCGASIMVDFDGSIAQMGVDESDLSSPEEDSSSESYSSPNDSPYGEYVGPSGFDGGSDSEESETSVLQTPDDEELDGKEMAEWGEDENSKVVTIGQKTRDIKMEEAPSEPEENFSESMVAGSVPSGPQFLEEGTQAIESHEISHPYDGEYESVNSSGNDESLSVGDIEKYGNSNSANDGPLLYSVVISGIDSQELRAQIKEALSDRRLLFDVDGILKDIKDGEMILNQISSLKAHVLVNQLMSLPLKFEWGQEANGSP